MTDVIVINREDASRACAKAINEYCDKLENSENSAEVSTEFYAMKMMECAVFSAMVVSKLFDEEENNDNIKWFNHSFEILKHFFSSISSLSSPFFYSKCFFRFKYSSSLILPRANSF